MKKSPKISPLEKTYLDRPKNKRIDGCTIAFILGILILIGVLYLAINTPVILNYILERFLGSSFLGNSTKYQIGNMTYDTKDILIDFFKNNLGKYNLGT